MRIQGKYNEYLKKLGKYDLMILDEFLLKSTSESEKSDLLELMEIRCNKKSTIFCSQYSFDGWHQLLNGGPIADAILDRIINSSYLITLHGKSLRETYSKLKKCMQVSIPRWRSHPIHENRAAKSIWTEPCNPLLRATKSTKRATSA